MLLVRAAIFFSLLFTLLFTQETKLPRIFVGYRIWEEPRAQLFFEYDESDRNPSVVTVTLKCPGAKEFKISNHPDFLNAKWRKMSKKLSWRLDKTSDVSTVFVAYKQQNEDSGQYEVTLPVSYSLDRKSLYKKLEERGGAYIDWTDGRLFLEVASKVENKDSRYNIGKAQTLAERKLKRQAYEAMKNLPLNFFYRIKDHLDLNPGLIPLVNQTIERIKLVEINYPDQNSARVKGVIALASNEKGLELAKHLKEYKEEKEVIVKKKYQKTYRDLVVDTRGMNLILCLFPTLVTEDGREVLNSSAYQESGQLFVKYLRSDNGYNWSSEVSDRLYIRAIEIKSGERSKIVISDRYAKLIQSNPKTYLRFTNGGFHVLVD